MDGDVGAVAFARFCQRAIKEDFDRIEFVEAVGFFEGAGEALGGTPGAEGVGTGGADAYFEHVEDGDGFVWQEW